MTARYFPNVHKDLRPVVRRLLREGWEWSHRGGGHYRLYPPDRTKSAVTISTSPSGRHGVDNVLRDLRKAGVEIT